MKKSWVYLAVSLAAAFIVWGIVGIFIPFVYDMNDDLFMRAFVSGAYTGNPDAHMIYMEYPLGLFLKLLYTIRRNIDWYGLWLMGCHYFSLGLCICRVLQEAKGKKRKLAVMGLTILAFAALWMSRSVILTFTTAAAAACAATIFWYGTMDEDKATVWEWVVLGLCAAAGFCTRKNVALMMIPLAGMVFWFKNRKAGLWKKWSSWKPVVLVIGLFVLIYAIDFAAYRSEAWREYEQFSALRSELFDYYGIPDYNENQSFYDEIGFDQNLTNAVEEYALILDERINTDALEKICDKAKEIKGTIPIGEKAKDTLQIVLENWFSIEYSPLKYAAILLSLYLLICFVRKKEKSALIWYLLTEGVMIALWFYLAYQGRVPARIGYSLHIFSLMTNGVFLWYLKKEAPSAKKMYSAIFTLLLLVGAAAGIIGTKTYAEASCEKNESYRAVLNYCEERNTNFYFLDVYSFSLYTDNFQIFLSSNEKNYMRLGDWMSYSPLYYEKLSHQGIEDVARAMAEKENVYFIARDDRDLQYLKEYMKSLNPLYTYEVVDTVQKDGFIFLVYKWKLSDENHRELPNTVIADIKCSENTSDAYLMLDHDSMTGWGCDAQTEGTEIIIQLNEEMEVSGVRMDVMDFSDTPKNLKIYLSEDGEEWKLVSAENVSNISYYFEPETASYLKLSLGEGMQEQWKWRIHEMTILGQK